MAASLVQQNNSDADLGDVVLTFGSAVTAGNTLLILVARESGSGTISGVTDNVNAGGYTSILDPFSGEVLAFVKRNVLGGTTTITAAATVGTDTWNAAMYEISGCSNSATILSGSNLNVSTTNHQSASSPLAGPGFGACAAEFSGSSDWAPGSGWITFSVTAGAAASQQNKVISSTTDSGLFTTVSTITTAAIMVLIPDTSADGGGSGGLRRRGLMTSGFGA